MQAKARSVKSEQAQLSAQLRTEGMTWPEIACIFQGRYNVNARVAFRIIRGWSQQDAANYWNERWPEDPKSFKNFSYWEQWPSSTGYEPSLGVLSKLAELYHCHVADLLVDAPNFRNLDAMQRGQERLNDLEETIPGPMANSDSYEIIDRDDRKRFEAMTRFINKIQETDVYELATYASTWARRYGRTDSQNSFLFKLSFALTLAAANPVSEGAEDQMTSPSNSGNLDLAGIWRSRYSYFSSGRGQQFSSTHYVVIRQTDQQLTIESIPHPSGSKIKLDTKVEGFTVTGTWEEQTSPTGYYKGSVYRGAIQLLASPTGGQMVGKWIGFSKNFQIDTGDWEFVLESKSTSDADISRYSMREED